MRGKVNKAEKLQDSKGITPAYAGKSYTTKCERCQV